MSLKRLLPRPVPLPGLLDKRGIDTVLITGAFTNVCCESSARDASTLGYHVILVADANAARRDQDHNATLHTIYRSFGDVRPTTDVIGLIDAARQLCHRHVRTNLRPSLSWPVWRRCRGMSPTRRRGRTTAGTAQW